MNLVSVMSSVVVAIALVYCGQVCAPAIGGMWEGVILIDLLVKV